MSVESLKRQWTVHLIHHTHTDVGYTDLQAKLARDHSQFIYQALDIIEAAADGARPEWKGFKWTCECFWSIEQFLRGADKADCDRLTRAIEQGAFGLSGTYLHFTELIDSHLLQSAVKRAAEFGRGIGKPVTCAMSADVNGFSWGFAQVLLDNGIRNLATCVHGHHGMPPLGNRQLPFYWRAPGGDEILVWNGEHYHFGNVLGFAPGGVVNFMFQDEFGDAPRTTRASEIAEVRIPRYLAQLEADDYPYSFIPIMVSGTASDNAPPNPDIARFAAEWNGRHGSNVLLQMSTLEDLFSAVRASDVPIQHLSGDWPDWWSDGVGSTPRETRLYRHVQREYRYLRALADHYKMPLPTSALEGIENNLVLFAEHTFGHSDSITLPHDLLVQAVAACKKSCVAKACELVADQLDHAFAQLGETPYVWNRPLRFRVINPKSHRIEDIASVTVEHQEFWMAERQAVIVDAKSGATIPSQKQPAPRGFSYRFPITLEPGEEREVELRPQGVTVSVHTRNFSDGVIGDVAGSEEQVMRARATATGLETSHVAIAWEEAKGITQWTDRKTGLSLINPAAVHSAFTPVYERTRAAKQHDGVEALRVRNQMGRNRKGPHVERHIGTLREARIIDEGEVFATVELHYEVPGTTMVATRLRAFADFPRVEVSVRIHKDSVWDPENLYIALPFRAPSDEVPVLWVDKAGAAMRPRIDQLPDTTTDFMCVQEGLALLASGTGTAIAIPDSPLLQLGPLEHGKRLLHGHPDARNDNARLYAWVLNNFWETNFEATVGGFHEFRFIVHWGPAITSPEEAFTQCLAMNTGVKTFRLSGEENGGG